MEKALIINSPSSSTGVKNKSTEVLETATDKVALLACEKQINPIPRVFQYVVWHKKMGKTENEKQIYQVAVTWKLING